MMLKSQEKEIRLLAAVDPDRRKILRFGLRNGASRVLQFYSREGVLARLYSYEQQPSQVGDWNTLLIVISGAPKLKLRFRDHEQIIDGHVADRWDLRFAREFWADTDRWLSNSYIKD